MVKAYLSQKGSGEGRNFISKVSKKNTLPFQISLTLVETSGGTISVGLWFRSLSGYNGDEALVLVQGAIVVVTKDENSTLGAV